jgi:hypothetical protein
MAGPVILLIVAILGALLWLPMVAWFIRTERFEPIPNTVVCVSGYSIIAVAWASAIWAIVLGG